MVYDLKGSESNRWEKGKGKTLLDTNYRLDRNAEPIGLGKQCFERFNQGLINDCKFLLKHQIIDYSLLLIIDKKNELAKLAIIDYIRQYTWEKYTETTIKYLINIGNTPTIISPNDYRERFVKAMQNNFIEMLGE